MHTSVSPRRLPLLLGVAFALLLAFGVFGVPAAFGETSPPQNFTAELAPLNNSGAQGMVTITRESDTAIAVTIEATGLSPNLPHAQHIHGVLNGSNTCPPAEADTDGDGFISVAEGVPFYGAILVSLTTEGATDTPMALDRFPVADANGNLSYQRTIELSADIVNALDSLHVVQHGMDMDGSGAYDGSKPSSLNPDVPFEATVPVDCGQIMVQGGGGVQVSRIAGAHRFATAVEIAKVAFPNGADKVYLARADIGVDALAGGTLTDGPILLVPSCDQVPQVVLDEVRRMQPNMIRPLGGTAAICDDVVQQVVDALQ